MDLAQLTEADLLRGPTPKKIEAIFKGGPLKTFASVNQFLEANIF